jgi:hypothetical protein
MAVTYDSIRRSCRKLGPDFAKRRRRRRPKPEEALDRFAPLECRDYLRHCGYGRAG